MPRVSKETGRARPNMTAEEKAEAVTIMCRLLSRGLYKHEIFKAFKKPWPANNPIYDPLSAQTCQRLYTRAQQLLLEMSNRPEEEIRAESMNIYMGVVRDPGASHHAVILARTRVDHMLGVDRPKKVDMNVTAQPSEDTSRLALERQKIVNNPLAAQKACEMIEALEGAPPTYGLKELSCDSPKDNGSASSVSLTESSGPETPPASSESTTFPTAGGLPSSVSHKNGDAPSPPTS